MHCRLGLSDCTSWPRQTNEERKLIHERGRKLKFTGRWEDLNGVGSEMESVNKESLKVNTTYTWPLIQPGWAGLPTTKSKHGPYILNGPIYKI